MPIAENIKPNPSVHELVGINYDTDTQSILPVDFLFMNLDQIIVNDGEKLFVEAISVGFTYDVAIRFWEGLTKRNMESTLDVINEAYYSNTSGSPVTIDVIINGFGGFGGDAVIIAGEYQLRVSRTSFKDGRTEKGSLS